MIDRRIADWVCQRLRHYPAVVLLGPRQAGKTTLARRMGGGREMVYLDLENPQDYEKPEDARGYLAAQRGKLVILDDG